MRAHAFEVACVLALAACGAEPGFTFAFAPGSGEARSYLARIDRAPREHANGLSVLMIGGGYSWDLHWTVPGSYETDGERTMLTLDGEPTRDADAIAGALVRAGFSVLRFSSVGAADPTRDAGNATPIGVADSFGLTRAAIEAFRAKGGFAPGSLILLGHSLGAARAGVVATEADVAGFVLLAPAYISPTGARPSGLSRDAIIRHGDPDGDGVVPAGGFSGTPAAFQNADRDGDGVLRGWELAASDRASGAIDIERDTDGWVGGARWPSDGLLLLDRPVLALFGGLDPISVHGPWLEAAGRDGRIGDMTVRYFAGLGHQLGAERNGLVGAMERRVIDEITAWLSDRFGRD